MSTNLYNPRLEMSRAPRRLARLAGALYLSLVLLGVFAHLYVRGGVHVPNEAAMTAGNIAAQASLFRLGFAADLLMATVFVALGVALYHLLAHVRRDAAAAMMLFVAVGSGLILANLVFHVGAAMISHDPTYASALGSEAADAMALLMMELHASGYAIAGIFFGLWLLPLGYLAYASDLFPRTLGALLMVSCFTYIVGTVTAFLFPEQHWLLREAIAAPSAVAEFWMVGYLLTIGVRMPRPGRPAPAAA